VISSARPPSVR